MMNQDEKDCGTPMSFQTVGLESFQSPPPMNNSTHQKTHSSNIQRHGGGGQMVSSYISNASILKPIFTERASLNNNIK
jgi:hypothetical protein